MFELCESISRSSIRLPRLPHRADFISIIPVRLLVDHIKGRLRAEPSCCSSTHGLVGGLGVILVDLNGLMATSSSSRIGHELCMATLLHAQEPEDRFLNGLADSQKTVVDEQSSLLVPEALGDILTLLFRQDNTVEALIKDMVVVKSAAVLCDRVQLTAQSTEGAAMDRVRVGSSDHIRAGMVDGGVDHECSGVEEANGAASNNIAGVVDLNKVGGFDEGEGHSEGVDPEG